MPTNACARESGFAGVVSCSGTPLGFFSEAEAPFSVLPWLLLAASHRGSQPHAADLRRSQWWRFQNYWTVLCAAPEAADASYPSVSRLSRAPALHLVLNSQWLAGTACEEHKTSTWKNMTLVACMALCHQSDSGAGLQIDTDQIHLSRRGYLGVFVEIDHQPVGVSAESSTAGWGCR